MLKIVLEQNKKIFIIIVLVVALCLNINNAFSANTPAKCTLDLALIAEEAVKMELMGYSVIEKSKCFNTSNLKYFAKTQDVIKEKLSVPVTEISDSSKIKILETKKDSVGLVRVSFKLIDGNKEYLDDLSFLLTNSSDQSKPCAAFTATPLKKYLYHSCKNR